MKSEMKREGRSQYHARHTNREQKKEWMSGDGCTEGYRGPGHPCW